MAIQLINQAMIVRFVREIGAVFSGSGTIYLVGETSLVVEGLRRFTDRLEFCSSVDLVDRNPFNRAVVQVAGQMGIKVSDEFPGEVIPLPDGYAARHRAVADAHWPFDLPLVVLHFDPYSVSYRCVARGGELDYKVVLDYLEHGWILEDEMIERLELLLPEFSFDTIQQDPAEFRRRMGSLWQMWENRQSHVAVGIAVS